jgi:hypothetical protein
MIEELKKAIYAITTDPSPEIAAWQVSGFLAAVSLCLEDPKLARKLDTEFRKEWSGLRGPGGVYNPAVMGGRIAMALKKGGSNGLQ